MKVQKICPGNGKCLSNEDMSLLDSSKSQPMHTDGVVFLNICESPGVAYDGENGTWHIMHIGPFETRGGIESITADGWPLGAAWEVGWAFTEWAASVRSTHGGENLKMPDFHLHHLNQFTKPPREGGKLWAGNKWWREAGCGDASSGLFTVANDLECDFKTSTEGSGCGTDFYYNALPEGYAYFVLPEHQTTEGRLTSFVQDLRPIGSPPLQWNIEIAALRVDTAHRRAAYKVFFGQDRAETYSRFQTQKLPAGFESLNWFQTHWPSDGKVLFGKVHTHGFAAEMWIIAGKLEDCGLSEIYVKANPLSSSQTYAVDARPLPMQVKNGKNISTLEDARSYIHHNIARTGKQIVCKYKFKNVTDAGGNTIMVLNVKDTMLCNSMNFTFEKGEPVTCIAFSYAPPADLYPKGFQAHFIWTPFIYLSEYDEFAREELQWYGEEAADRHFGEWKPHLRLPKPQAQTVAFVQFQHAH
jgi:hypothetical protein